MAEPSVRRTVTVLVPVLNEEGNVERAYEEVRSVFAGLSDRYDFELLFTDNHSSDSTFQKIAQLAKADSRVRAVRFARNFGFQRSVMTGYRLASGEAVIQMDCDLQDSPTNFPRFLELWEQGHDVVVGVRRTRNENQALQAGRRLYYRLLKRVSNDNLMLDGGDFRLVDRSVVDELKRVEDHEPYTRGLTSMLAVNQIGVPYDRADRQSGKSKFPLGKLFSLAVDGFVAHSTIPLRISSYVGITIAVLTCLASLFYIVTPLFFDVDWPAGFATTTVFILFGTSLNAIFLGIIGEYIGRIYNQLRPRPTTIVEARINMPTGMTSHLHPGASQSAVT